MAVDPRLCPLGRRSGGRDQRRDEPTPAGFLPTLDCDRIGSRGSVVILLLRGRRIGPFDINEGWFGRFFEVTPAEEIVWEYVNPYFGVRQNFVVNAVQRAYRYGAEDIAKAKAS